MASGKITENTGGKNTMTIKKGLDGRCFLVTKNPFSDSDAENCVVHTEKSFDKMIEYCKTMFAESYRKGEIKRA